MTPAPVGGGGGGGGGATLPVGHQPVQPSVVGESTEPGMIWRVVMPGPVHATPSTSPPASSFMNASMKYCCPATRLTAAERWLGYLSNSPFSV